MADPATSESFDFGLSPDQEARARRLFQESIVVDMLFVGPCGPDAFTEEMNAELRAEYARHRNGERAYWTAMSLPARWELRGKSSAFREWWEASGVTAGSREAGIGSFDQTIKEIGNFSAQFDGLDWLVRALTAQDIRRAKAEGRRAAFIHTQDTRAIEQDLDRLNVLRDLGMRMVQLTYNSMNFVGVGCTERTDAGLSYFGVKVLQRLNDLGMMVDVSHTGRQSALDACQLSRDPVVASHTCAKALSGHDRAKDDDVLQAVAATGGVVGVVTVPAFLSRQPDPTIEDFLDHVDYIARLIGANHVGIGTDWPSCAPRWLCEQLGEMTKALGFRDEHRVDLLKTLKGFRDHRAFINIGRGLVSRGYSDPDIEGILGGNFLRVFEAVCG